MAAFTPADPDDRAAFDAHMAKVRSSPDSRLRAVTCDGQLVGSVATFIFAGDTDVTYWIARSAWGHGIASQALELITDLVPTRPLHARAASDNLASLRVLQKYSGCSRNPVSRSSEPRSPSHPAGKAKSRKPFAQGLAPADA